jgi:predicted transcriptional regulator
MTTLTVPLNTKRQARLENFTKRTHMPKEKVLQTALDRFLAIQELEAIRKVIVPKARKQGYKTDEDIFKAM